eukprot:CAMPEP_0114558944 /NCGR_PEP_ID=MMETSP0114-20121206/10661_1 /TAXON_ID=31324 /ORGANISM="Goniomonas sp, Strain m" /LENGTH=215 /DNA_ID=CAMNT_0001744387 /DNA_START=97 /DNA_END=744 /DNA_ORIENTATION=-
MDKLILLLLCLASSVTGVPLSTTGIDTNSSALAHNGSLYAVYEQNCLPQPPGLYFGVKSGGCYDGIRITCLPDDRAQIVSCQDVDCNVDCRATEVAVPSCTASYYVSTNISLTNCTSLSTFETSRYAVTGSWSKDNRCSGEPELINTNGLNRCDSAEPDLSFEWTCPNRTAVVSRTCEDSTCGAGGGRCVEDTNPTGLCLWNTAYQLYELRTCYA